MLRGCLHIVFPWLAEESRVGRWLAHVILWTTAFAAAVWWGPAMALQQRLVSPWPGLHVFWLPTLVGAFYLASWCAGGIKQMLIRPEANLVGAEVDLAWDECLRTLHLAQIDPLQTPLFLVFGQPLQGTQPLWDAAGLRWVTPPTPFRSDAPMQIIASRGAVFIAVRRTESSDRNSLRALLHRLNRVRQPYCAVNGVLVVVPYSATATDAATERALRPCQQELEEVRLILGIECPVTFLVSDLQCEEAVRDWLPGVPENRRGEALGQTFPLMPDLEPMRVGPMLAEGATWLARETLPALVYQQMSPEPVAQARNERLAAWIADLHERAPRLGQLTAALAPEDVTAPPLVIGCFLAATGTSPTEQAFVPGVFRTMLNHQDDLAWAPARLEGEAVCRSWTHWVVGSVAAAALGFVALGAAGWMWR